MPFGVESFRESIPGIDFRPRCNKVASTQIQLILPSNCEYVVHREGRVVCQISIS